MKGFVEVIQGEDRCPTGLLPKDISGRTCRRRRKNMSRNVISAKDLHRISTSLEERSIRFPVHGLLLNEA